MKKISEEILYRGRWLFLKKDLFVNSSNEEVSWETVGRTDNPLSFGIIAKLNPSGRYVFIKQFRHSINNYVIGLPAGIAGGGAVSGKALEDCILKELAEETGYRGVIKSRSPLLKLNPAVMDGDFLLVSAEIDENDPGNKDLRQELEPEEEIEVILVEKDGIKDFLREEIAKGSAVSSGIWSLACGLDELRLE